MGSPFYLTNLITTPSSFSSSSAAVVTQMAGLEEGSLDDCRVQDSSDESHTPLKEKQSFLVLFIVSDVIITINILRVFNNVDPPPYPRHHRQRHGECDAEDGDPLSHSSPFSVVLMIPS